MPEPNISSVLRNYRERRNLSPREVVEKLRLKGIDISEKTLYGYENGVSNPKVNTFIALCDVYEINDVLGTFSEESERLCSPVSAQWEIDQYNDFFNGSLLEKIFLLIKWGIPDFAGYESKLENLMPSNSAKANFDKLYSVFMQLDEVYQGILLRRAETLLADQNANTSEAIRSATELQASLSLEEAQYKKTLASLHSTDSIALNTTAATESAEKDA